MPGCCEGVVEEPPGVVIVPGSPVAGFVRAELPGAGWVVVVDGEEGDAEGGLEPEGLDDLDCALAAPMVAANISPATEVTSSLDMDTSRAVSASKIPRLLTASILNGSCCPSNVSSAVCCRPVRQAAFAAFRSQGCVTEPDFAPGATL